MSGLTVGAVSGLLGAYTTFSAFAYETQELIREGQIALAAGNAVGSVVAGSGLYRRDSAGAGYGAFMEPSGRNLWQPVANSSAAKTAQIGETVAVGCDRLPRKCHGKEGSTVQVRQRALQNPA
jgi:CrcB-like protein involved in camphor resistance